MRGKKVLLVNPWIYDFAAYDLWAKPLGLLYLAGLLRRNGCAVHWLDCLAEEQPVGKAYGQGPFRREIVAKPAALKTVPRHFARYGMRLDTFQARLGSLPEPDAVLVTALMTYWYPGVFEVIRLVKAAFPRTPVVLGGIYATLCGGHARQYSGADYLIDGPGEGAILDLLAGLWGAPPEFRPDPENLDGLPYPAWDLVPGARYACILTARGCPMRCPYCASHLLTPGVQHRAPAAVAAEIAFWRGRGIRDFAFYDDALLHRPEDHALPLFELIRGRGLDVRFHCPNALNARAIDAAVARAIHAAGFKTVRLGFETADPARQRVLGAKVSTGEFVQAVENLAGAGFERGRIGAYLLCGLPGQAVQELRESIALVKSLGVRPLLAEYSPIPGTALWEQAVQTSPFPLAEEPLWQNKTLLPCRSAEFTLAIYEGLKRETRTR